MRQLTQPTAACARARRGASAAELAVILPVLMLMALGCVDFGRFAYHYIALQNAARTGAEYGITTPYTPAALTNWANQLEQAARGELTGQTGYDSARLTLTRPVPVTLEPSGLRRVRVELTYTGFETLVSWPGIPDSPTMRAVVEMRAIR